MDTIERQPFILCREVVSLLEELCYILLGVLLQACAPGIENSAQGAESAFVACHVTCDQSDPALKCLGAIKVYCIVNNA